MPGTKGGKVDIMNADWNMIKQLPLVPPNPYRIVICSKKKITANFNTINSHLYHHAGNNPIKYTDPDGRDVILLLDPDGAPAPGPIGDIVQFGHSAALVGNDEDGWLFYSNNGPNGISVGEYSSVEEFKNEYSSQEKHFTFTQEQRLSTTPEQDQKMKEKALGLAGTTIEQVRASDNNYLVVPHAEGKPYRTLTNNCSQHVAAIVEAGGQYSSNSIIPKLQVLMSPETNKQVQRNGVIGFSIR
ncbi:hypothetical protein LQZ19_02915 [Treponema primitia]|uniref:hypothetical protein n=1 Tax=Treponema primitia TaxID=88058 RepID=UPI0039810D9E